MPAVVSYMLRLSCAIWSYQDINIHEWNKLTVFNYWNEDGTSITSVSFSPFVMTIKMVDHDNFPKL